MTVELSISPDSKNIFNFHIRVSDLFDIADKMTNAGWMAVSAPVEYAFGSKVVRQWIPRNKDAIFLSLIQRISPPLDDQSSFTTSSNTFNSAQMVKDMDSAIGFYQNILGFETVVDQVGTSTQVGENVLGLSHEAMTGISRKVRIIRPDSKIGGSIELVQFDGYSGRDFSDLAIPPNLGSLMLRFPVLDVEQLAEHLRGAGITLQYEPIVAEISPYGLVKIVAVQAPDGAWLEFFEEQ